MSKLPVRRREVLKTAGIGVAGVAGVSQATTAAETTDDTDPTEIEDWHDLDAVRDDLNGEYVLVNDLDEGTAGYDEHVGDSEEGWEPIGSGGFDGTPFDGQFNGSDYEIAALRVDKPDTTGVGLFGGNGGTIENVTLSQTEIIGDSEIGSLVGKNSGTVRDCTASGDVSGDSRVGVLIGWNTDAIVDSTVSGTVSGRRNVGGLAGQNNGKVVGSLAKADVTGEELIGGLVGQVFFGEVRNSHYSIEEVRINDGEAVTIGGLFEEQYQDWEGDRTELDVSDYDSLKHIDGSIEIENAQGIRDALGFIYDPDKSWRLGADIDLTGESADLFLPYLAGDFNGKDRTVTVDINRPALAQIGFIGYNDNSVITSLTIEGQVVANSWVGGLLGDNHGEVLNSHSEVDVTGEERVGGFVGDNRGTIRGCSASGNVSGAASRLGGFAGQSSNTLERCQASGNVTGESLSSDVGGLVGWGSDAISDSIAKGEITGEVSSNRSIGGLIGRFYRGEAEQLVAVEKVDGNQNVGALVGGLGNDFLDEDEHAILRNSYWDVSTTGQETAVDEISEGDGTAEVQGEVTDLTTAEMQGEAAAENMSALDFGETWDVVTDPDDYPVLQLQEIDEDPSVTDYTSEDDVVETDGLRDGIDDWRTGEIDTGLLRDVIDYWRSGEPVE